LFFFFFFFFVSFVVTIHSIEVNNVCKNGKKVLWFTAIDSCLEEVRNEYFKFLVAALNSARINSPSLVPYVLYNGNESRIPDSLKSMKWVNFFNHQLSFSENLKKCDEKYNYQIGAYFRLDIPLIMESLLGKYALKNIDLEYVLYTDTDVLFFKDIDSCSLPKPSVISIGPENYKNTSGNSGVLYMNVSAMKNHHNELISFADSNCWKFSAYDQGLILSYFVYQGLSNKLPDEYNWKGYWGGFEKNDIVIAHFHGPKPGRCLDCFLTFRHFKDNCRNCSPYGYLFESIGDHGKMYEKLLIDFHKYS
jgi:hypothetical protein